MVSKVARFPNIFAARPGHWCGGRHHGRLGTGGVHQRRPGRTVRATVTGHRELFRCGCEISSETNPEVIQRIPYAISCPRGCGSKFRAAYVVVSYKLGVRVRSNILEQQPHAGDFVSGSAKQRRVETICPKSQGNRLAGISPPSSPWPLKAFCASFHVGGSLSFIWQLAPFARLKDMSSELMFHLDPPPTSG